jgi:copper chaperone CopZ
MFRTIHAVLMALSLVTLAAWMPAQAASPVTYTTIHVHDMHCADCAKQIARKLYALPGVVEVRADVAKNIAMSCRRRTNRLRRGPWEAVESAGFKVAKLEALQSAYTTKPR